MTTSVPPDNGDGRGPINVGRVSVERMSVDKSEIKSAEVDILIALSQATMDQTDTIQSSNAEIAEQLKKIVEGKSNIEGRKDLQDVIDALKEGFRELIPAINKSAKSAEEGAESNGLAGAEMKRSEKSFKAINKEANSLREAFVTLEEIEDVVKENYLEPSRKLGAETLKLISSVTRLSTVMERTTKQFSDSADLAGAGLVDFRDVFINQFEKLWSPIDKAGDDIIESGMLIRRSIENDLVSPMLLVGGNINTVSKSFNKFRGDLEDIDLRMDAFADFRGQNDMIAEFLDVQRRRGITDDLNSGSMQTSFVNQQKTLQMIAANTGLTVKELSKSLAINAKSLDELAALGIISGEQADNIKLIDIAFEKSGNKRGSELLRLITEAQGDSARFGRQNPELFKGIQMSGRQDLIEAISESSKAGNVDLAMSQIREMTAAVKEVTNTEQALEVFGKNTNATFFRELVAQTNAMKDFTQDPKFEVAREYFNKFVDFATNTFPLTAAASVIAIGYNTLRMVGLTLAISNLTAAIWANGGLGGIGGKKGGKGPKGGGKFSKFKSVGSKLLKGAGPLAALTAGGMKAMDVAGDDELTLGQKTTQVGATTAGAGLGFWGGAALGAAIGGPLAPITGLLGGIAGSMLGSAGGDIIGGGISDMMGSSTPTTPATAATSPVSSPAMMSGATSGMASLGEKSMALTSRQIMILTSINARLVESNGIQRGIRDKIGLSTGNDVGPKGRDASKATSGASVFQGRLGAAD